MPPTLLFNSFFREHRAFVPSCFRGTLVPFFDSCSCAASPARLWAFRACRSRHVVQQSFDVGLLSGDTLRQHLRRTSAPWSRRGYNIETRRKGKRMRGKHEGYLL